MSPLRRLWNVVRRTRLDNDLRQELDTHLALIEEEERAHGSSAEEARHKARARFGNPLSYRERALDAVIATWLENTGKEVIFAARRLVRSPAFTLASVLTLALAIGANVSIFAVVHRVVLNPLPYPDSGRLITLDHGAPGRNLASGISMPLGLYYQYLDRARTLDAMALYRTEEMTLTGEANPERIRVTRATPSLASVIRVAPAHGRWFTEAEGAPGASQVGLLSYGLWVRRYGSDRAILGRSVTLNGVPTEIIGVVPASFAFPDPRIDVWIPHQIARSTDFDVFTESGVARMRDGTTVAGARADLNRAIADLPQAYPNDSSALNIVKNLKLTSTAMTLKEATVGSIARTLWILLASVGLVLLVACANVANLFLVRSEARQREVAVRRALGAGRLGIARYFLTESALLSIAGGMIGVALAWGAVRLLVTVEPATLPRLHEISLDGIAAAFTVVLTLLAALVFGAIPLLHSTPLAVSLHEGGRSNTTSLNGHRVRHLLMGGQIALALVLLVASGLLVRSFQRLRAVDPGFDATSTLTFRIGLPASEYPTRGAAVAAHQALLDRLSALPGVTAVSASTVLPLTGFSGYTSPLYVQGQDVPPGVDPRRAASRAVAGGYIEGMGMRVLRGRSIDRRDVERGEPIAVINEALVKVFFPNEDPIGQRVRVPPLNTPTWLTIVGVVSNTPTRTLAEANPVPQLYVPMLAAHVGPPLEAMSYVVRTAPPPLGLLPAVRGAIGEIDRNLALAQVRTLQEILDGASAQMAFTMVLLAIAAAVALMLGVIGVYGVMSYIVSQRTGEIGVRLALGAEPGSVAGMIVRQGGLVVLAGITVGLATALAGSRLVGSLLYGVSPRDPSVFATTTLTLFAVALLACWLPARRAARLNPLDALRAN